jgi:hypothetical protein
MTKTIANYTAAELRAAEARMIARIAAIDNGAPATPDSRHNAVMMLARIRRALAKIN